MKRQLNVGEQCDLIRNEMKRLTRQLRAGRMAWLESALRICGEDPWSGIIAEYRAISEQGGELGKGVWLNSEKRFSAFEILHTCDGSTVIEIERWEDITGGAVVSGHLPGKGKSIGFLAVGLLEQGVEA